MVNPDLFCPQCYAVFEKSSLDTPSIFGPHHADILSLQSAARGCRICKAIWLECVTGFGKEDWSSAEVSTQFRLVQYEQETVQQAILEGVKIELRIGVERVTNNDVIQRDMVFDLLPYQPSEHYAPSHVRRFDTRTKREETQKGKFRDRQPDDLARSLARENTGRVSSEQRLLEWYRNCLGNHKECRPIFDGSYTPSRLLDIGQTPADPLRLIDYGGKHLHAYPPAYATLSHCWGKSQPLQLLTTNIQQMRDRIPRESIPRVFSETIEVCWHLGIRYLWIDCLCILQDSVEDWAQESRLMGVVYARAVINIGATNSTGCNDGLFNTTKEAARAARIEWKAVPQRDYVVVENDTEWGKSFMNQPLLRRAWVMQERLLAIRMIHFTNAGLIWECRTTAATESYPVKMPDALWPFHDTRNRFWRVEFTESDSAWSAMLFSYSQCELTFGKDKLVALAGLVSALEATGLARGRYWAGMWEVDLPYCLLWTRAAIDKKKCARPARPYTYRAPSWSWASLDYPIWTEWTCGTSESSLVTQWEVKEDRGSVLAPPLPFALSIRIVGPISQAAVARKRPWIETIGRGIERVQGTSYSISGVNIVHDGTLNPFWDDPYNEVVFDDFDERNLDKRIWCAPIYECEEWVDNADFDKRLVGLLLEEVHHNTFRRIGAFSIGNPPDQQVLKGLPPCEYNII